MPYGQVGAISKNLQDEKPGNGGIKEIVNDLLSEITDISELKREKNNIYMSTKYRIDARKMSGNSDGGRKDDYKVDIQTITKTKNLSRTVAVAFVAPDATDAADLRAALEGSVRNSFFYRVT